MQQTKGLLQDAEQLNDEIKNLVTSYQKTMSENEPIVSTMQDDDPEFQNIIDLFLTNLPEMMINIMLAYEGEQRDKLKSLCHELKGASGSLGFPQLMDISARIEVQLREGSLENLADNVNELHSISNRIIAGYKNHIEPGL